MVGPGFRLILFDEIGDDPQEIVLPNEYLTQSDIDYLTEGGKRTGHIHIMKFEPEPDGAKKKTAKAKK